MLCRAAGMQDTYTVADDIVVHTAGGKKSLEVPVRQNEHNEK